MYIDMRNVYFELESMQYITRVVMWCDVELCNVRPPPMSNGVSCLFLITISCHSDALDL